MIDGPAAAAAALLSAGALAIAGGMRAPALGAQPRLAGPLALNALPLAALAGRSSVLWLILGVASAVLLALVSGVDPTWDGPRYHVPGALRYALGWNPLTERAGFYPHDNHSGGLWRLKAAVWRATESLAAARAWNPAFALASLALVLAALGAAGWRGPCAVGFAAATAHPLLSNLLRHGAAVHPPPREILARQIPPELTDAGQGAKLAALLFSETGGHVRGAEVRAKWPWQFRRREFRAADAQPWTGGFGPFFGAIFLVTAGAVAVACRRGRRGPRGRPARILPCGAFDGALGGAIGATVAIALVFPEPWWARLLPMLAPAVILATGLASRVWPALLRLAHLGTIPANTAVFLRHGAFLTEARARGHARFAEGVAALSAGPVRLAMRPGDPHRLYAWARLTELGLEVVPDACRGDVVRWRGVRVCAGPGEASSDRP